MPPFVRIIAAAVIALVGLILYNGIEVNPDTFGLDPTVTLATESWEGQTFTASDVAGIKMLVARERAELPDLASGCPPFVLLWLGNSQLHYINQSQAGDHVAPFWLRKESTCPSGTVPLGVSLPNANLQEHYILSDYVLERLPVQLVLLELCFDDLREDGLRDEFSALLPPAGAGSAPQAGAWTDIVERAEAGWQHADRSEENSGLEGFAQKQLEDRLDGEIGRVWPLWRDRPNLRVKALTDLYYLRNGLLGIKPTTIRRLIAARYKRNMDALEALLREAQEQHIKVITYIAPIRHDVPLPYDVKEYADWQHAILELGQKYNTEQINLENLVPADLWGSYVSDEIDFMHFRGKGHQLLAKALLPYVEAVRQERR